MAVEWVQLGADAVLVATSDRAWLHTPSPLGDPFAHPMMAVGRVDTTRRLLEGAVRAGLGTGEAQGGEAPPTASRWAWRLVGDYHMARVAPALFSEAAARLRAQGRASLAGWVEVRARQERGREALALQDLVALGYDAEAEVAAHMPDRAAALVEHFMDCVRQPDPAGCVGYAYALDRVALCYDGAYIRRVQSILPPHVDATRSLRKCSGVGADSVHAAETVALVASLPAPERAAVAVSAHRTATLSARPEPMDGDWASMEPSVSNVSCPEARR